MKLAGRVWKFPQDDINTDQIRPKMYAHLPLKDQAKHCLEVLDREFGDKVWSGDIVVAGRNFGAGSSTPAYAALIALGIAAVVAESFARVFFRGSISGGLVVIPCPGIVELVTNGDRIEVDTVANTVVAVTTGRTLACTPLPGVLREMVELGGEKAYLKARIAAAAR
jgi:3-isopropylmalate/(R)-2-methylmalate dehydratase small subunit